MANADKTLQDKDYVNIYPITRERNVYDENNVNLKEKFKNVVFNDNEVFKFSQEQYEESANIIETENASGTVGGVEYVSFDNKTTLNGTATSSSDIWLKLKYPIKAGTTFSFNQFANTSELNQGGIWLAKGINDWANRVQVYGGKENISLNYDINYISIHLNSGTTYSSYYITPMAVLDSEKPTNYFRYNPNRNITNSEAEFLKEEHEESYNLCPVSSIPTWNKFLNVNVENGKTYTISFDCDGYRNFSLKKNDGNGATFIAKYDFKGHFSQIFTADWTGDIFINGYASSVTPTGTTFTNIILVEGNKEFVYKPYNSASHITNAQADLLKSEYEKSSNLWAMPLTPMTINAGSEQWKGYYDILKYCEIGKTYTLSVEDVPDGIIAITIPNYQVVSQGEKYTFTYTEGMERALRFGNNTGSQAKTFTPKIMLVEGSEKKGYQPYNGEIIHRAYITPVSLWKSANPNVAMTEQTLNIPNLDNFNYYGLVVKSKSTNTTPEFIVVKRVLNSYYTIFMRDGDNSFYRSIRTLSNSIEVGTGKYSASGNNNDSCIIMEIYGFNSL